MPDSRTEVRPPDTLSPSPTVTIVVLVYNRREALRRTLREMLEGTTYDPGLIEVVVVDNASEDGSAEMVTAEFPQVRVIRRQENRGISGWNEGFAVATGDLVLVLDDDCYLPADGLARAIAAMQEHEADMVSFSVVAAADPGHRFDLAYRTGLLNFWGCAVLIRREVLARTGGFDPEIFVWGHEVEFMLRFFDEGFCHLHLPEVTAIHMKDPAHGPDYYSSPAYRYTWRHYAYIAAKRLRARDALGTLVALLTANTRHAIRVETARFSVMGDTIAGFVRGLRSRDRLKDPRISRTYRRNLNSFASPWWVMRSPMERLRQAEPGVPSRRLAAYYERRARYYPDRAATLRF